MFAVVPFLPFLMQPPRSCLGVLFVGGPIVVARITAQPKMRDKIGSKTDERA